MNLALWIFGTAGATIAVLYVAAIIFAAIIVHMDCHGEARGEISAKPAKKSASPQASSEHAALSPTREPQPSAAPVPRQ